MVRKEVVWLDAQGNAVPGIEQAVQPLSTSSFSSEMPHPSPIEPHSPSDQLRSTAKFSEPQLGGCLPSLPAEPDAPAPSNIDIHTSNSVSSSAQCHSKRNTEAKRDEPLAVAEPNCDKCPRQG